MTSGIVKNHQGVTELTPKSIAHKIIQNANPHGREIKTQPKIIQTYVSKKEHLNGRAGKMWPRTAEKSIHLGELYEVFAESASSNAMAPLARPAPQAVWADFKTLVPGNRP